MNLKQIERKIERFISLKNYIVVLLTIAFIFYFIDKHTASIIFMVYAFIGLLLHDKLKREIWLNKK